MARVVLIAALLVSAVASAEPSLIIPDHVQALVNAQVRAIQEQVATLRGLPWKLEVPVSLEDTATIRAHALEDAEEPDAIEAALALKATLAVFRLAPADLDVDKVYADLMEEALGGYYDPETQHLVLVQRDALFMKQGIIPGSEEMITATHELVHALQDQHFDLWAMNDRDLEDDDVDMAVSCLIEGDATLAMMLQSNPAIAQLSGAAMDTMVKLMSDISAAPPDSAMGRAPKILVDSLLMPYGQGLAFAHESYRNGGWERINKAYTNPPMSTEQILHPERFLGPNPDWPIRIELPDMAKTFGDGWSTVDTNTMGEAGIVGMLRFQTSLREDIRARATDGWGGDRYTVVHHAGGNLAAVWTTTWDSPRDAAEFTTAAFAWVQTLIPTFDGPRARRGVTAWSSRDGSLEWRLIQDGVDVHLLIDVPVAVAPVVTDALHGLPRRELTRLDDVAPVKGTPRGGDDQSPSSSGR